MTESKGKSMNSDEKNQLARDFIKDLMTWKADLADLKKRFEAIEEKIYINFGGHLVKGYIEELTNRYDNALMILVNFLKG